MGVLKNFWNDFVRLLSGEPEQIGEVGEDRVARNLYSANKKGYSGLIMRNLYVPKEDGTTSQIDLLYITKKGLFVIENKNYSGYIFGNEQNRYWMQTLYAGKDEYKRNVVEKHKFYNPIWQNKTHIKNLRKYLLDYTHYYIPAFSFIVFSNNCELKNITYTPKDLVICYLGELKEIMAKFWDNSKDVLTDEQINQIFKALLPLENNNEEQKEKHIKNIQKRKNDVGVCPYCGGKLVLRTAKQGSHKGEEFWGCSNYPKCKYIKNK